MSGLDSPVDPFTVPEPSRVAKYTQTILAAPELHREGVYGNCLQYAIASLLGCHPDAVPHFAQFTWWEGAFKLWARGHGLDPRWVTADAIPDDALTLLLGKSPRGWGHACVGMGRDVIWDPHPTRDGLTEIESAVLIEPWVHGDPHCWACNRSCGCRRREQPVSDEPQADEAVA